MGEQGVTARRRIGWGRPAVSALLALVLGFSAVACGSTNSDITLTVGSGDSTEEIVLGQIYAQALEMAGYTVEKDLNLEPNPSPEELQEGRLSGYPEHLSSAMSELIGIELDEVPADPEQAYRKAEAGFEKNGLTAFPPTPFPLENVVGMRAGTAEERGLKTVSDLKGQSEEMTLTGGATCHISIDCLGGLEVFYGIVFKAFAGIEPQYRYKVLENEEVDASMLFSTDGRLAAEPGKFVVLEEDKHAFPAGNAIWLTTPDVVDEAGPDYEKAIVGAQKGLTLTVMRKLDAEVELEKKPAAKVAAQYLKSIGYTG